MISPQNIVEYEAHIDDFEEQQEILRQLAQEENFEIGDLVVLVNPVAQSFWSGVHQVEVVSDGFLKIRLWHGKRSIGVTNNEIRKATQEEIETAEVL